MATHIKQDSFSNTTACPCRTGQTIFNGTVANATILASGTGSVFLLGTNTSVTVDLAGVSDVWLRNTESERLHTEQTHLSVFAHACSEAVWLQKARSGLLHPTQIHFSGCSWLPQRCAAGSIKRRERLHLPDMSSSSRLAMRLWQSVTAL